MACYHYWKKGVFTTNRNKTRHPGKIVTTFAMGSQKLYDFVDDNPEVVFLDVEYTNDTRCDPTKSTSGRH